jgi:hypothetical protein
LVSKIQTKGPNRRTVSTDQAIIEANLEILSISSAPNLCPDTIYKLKKLKSSTYTVSHNLSLEMWLGESEQEKVPFDPFNSPDNVKDFFHYNGSTI